MGSGGTISAMVSSLKNNKIKKRKFHDSFRDVDGITLNNKPLIYKNNLSKQEFKEFSKKLRDKKRRSNIIMIVIYGISILSVFIIVFGFL